MMTRAPELPWFRRHSLIEGNEFADRIAKAGCFRALALNTHFLVSKEASGIKKIFGRSGTAYSALKSANSAKRVFVDVFS
ncbi:hypothetical protein LAZ67_X003928 [Cordylochernes scorpioides]|uniref:RNase H type-1 domain-containing protein n=1 Tax=Cordylochernes scorpioides TaxID=51811 RepID=A0ABY6LXS9_9ARAC|nr:hypothetical protein LAZ67_X003928 [Cordylochernes scorpioides]